MTAELVDKMNEEGPLDDWVTFLVVWAVSVFLSVQKL